MGTISLLCREHHVVIKMDMSKWNNFFPAQCGIHKILLKSLLHFTSQNIKLCMVFCLKTMHKLMRIQNNYSDVFASGTMPCWIIHKISKA